LAHTVPSPARTQWCERRQTDTHTHTHTHTHTRKERESVCVERVLTCIDPAGPRASLGVVAVEREQARLAREKAERKKEREGQRKKDRVKEGGSMLENVRVCAHAGVYGGIIGQRQLKEMLAKEAGENALLT
jgi:hypothetical protein